MKLKFLGNGSGFAKTHTGAYFIDNKDLVVIDCSMLNLQKILDLGMNNFKNVYLLITHMHDDHFSGVSLFIQYMNYIYKNKLNLVLPSELIEDVKLEFKIKGIPNTIYNLINVDENKPNWFINKIKTQHAPELEGKCFGYVLDINNTKICYSGDTNILNVYEPYLNECKEFYIDVSALYGGVHLKYSNVEDNLLSYIRKYKLDIYMMHIDDEEELRKIKHSSIKIVELN